MFAAVLHCCSAAAEIQALGPGLALLSGEHQRESGFNGHQRDTKPCLRNGQVLEVGPHASPAARVRGEERRRGEERSSRKLRAAKTGRQRSVGEIIGLKGHAFDLFSGKKDGAGNYIWLYRCIVSVL